MPLADRLIDATARRPSGWIVRKTYGGTLGAPKGHETVFDEVLDVAGPLEGARCLEVGCGGGRLLERVLAADAASAAGLDHSPDILALCRERNREAVERGALELKLGDAAQLPWPDGAFTVVLSANTFFFLQQPELVLAELHRVVSPGGRVVIGTVPGPLPTPSLPTGGCGYGDRGCTSTTTSRCAPCSTPLGSQRSPSHGRVGRPSRCSSFAPCVDDPADSRRFVCCRCRPTRAAESGK